MTGQATTMRASGRSRAFLSNTLWSLLLQLVTLVVGFIVPQAIIRTYGSETNGLVSSLTQFVSYISLVEAGISAAAVYALYDPLAKNDQQGIDTIVSAAKRFYQKSGGLFTVGALALAVCYPIFVHVRVLDSPRVFVLVIALCATGFLDFFTLAKYRVLLTASQRNWVIQIATIVYKVLYTGVVLVFSALGVSVEIVYVIAIGPILVRSLVLVIYTRRIFPSVDFSARAQGYKLDQRWDALYLQILGVVQTGAPIIIATFVTQNLSDVSVFSIYLLVANGIRNAVSSVTQGTQASFGDVIARGETETLKRSFREFQVLAYGVTAILCGVAFALIMPFITLYTEGMDTVSYYYPVIGFFSVLEVLLYHLKTPQGLLVISAGMYRETRVQTTVQALILVIAGIALGKIWSIPGILAGACLSDLYRTFDLAFFVPARITRTKPLETFALLGLCLVGCILTAAPFVLLHLESLSWGLWVASGVLLLVWGGVVMGALYWLGARSELSGLLHRVRGLAGRK